MSFNELNPETGKPWTRAELFEALDVERTKCAELLAMINRQGIEPAQDIITWPEQAANLRARWAIHLDESSTAMRELRELGTKFRTWIDNQRQYIIDNPLIKS